MNYCDMDYTIRVATLEDCKDIYRMIMVSRCGDRRVAQGGTCSVCARGTHGHSVSLDVVANEQHGIHMTQVLVCHFSTFWCDLLLMCRFIFPSVRCLPEITT